ncbi:hypothetical protein JCM10908_003186 [Rhodotorula pacifica]|uniref:polysaccharide deacetylase family protein n=1 Tax=Rhodotorula pacifica TaxID=1495444 RepID=UPI00317F9FA8
MPKRALVTIGIDLDCVAGWLGSYGGEDSPNDISRGVFAAEVGIPRLVKMLDKYSIKASFFVPGHTLDSFPKECALIRDAGHEFGLHGYSHENPIAMTLEQQRDVLDHTFDQLTEFCGKPPVGCTAPWWENSKEGVQLLLEKGIQYDHSSQAHDCMPFYTRDEDTWTKIDLTKTKRAKEWMKPLVKGKLTPLVTIPANWYLDDLPCHLYIKASHASHGYVDADVTLKLWKAHFDYFYREEEWFVFPLTLHPDTAGRPHVLMTVERLIEYIKTFEGVEFCTMADVNKEFRERNPYSGDDKQ